MKVIKRRINCNYTTISNEALRDNTLSHKAKGLLCMIIGLPEEWVFSVEGLTKISKEGLSSIYATINELIDKGYCKRVSERENGKFVRWTYYFSAEKSLLEKPFMENPKMDNPYMENQMQINNNKENNYNNKENNYINQILTPEEQEFYDGMKEHYPNISKMKEPLQLGQYQKLLSLYAEERVKAILESMENSLQLTKKYISAYRTANNWIRNDIKRTN